MRDKNTLKSIKVSKESYDRLKMLVYVKYNMETYKNLRIEVTKALEHHCDNLLSQLPPNLKKKYEALIKGT